MQRQTALIDPLVPLKRNTHGRGPLMPSLSQDSAGSRVGDRERNAAGCRTAVWSPRPSDSTADHAVWRNLSPWRVFILPGRPETAAGGAEPPDGLTVRRVPVSVSKRGFMELGYECKWYHQKDLTI